MTDRLSPDQPVVSFKHVDLFSGIGGFALAAQMQGIETVAFCEIDEFAQFVLRARFPGVPIYDDVRGNGRLSVPGLERGGETGGPVGLAELCPDWVVVENVAHTWRRWVPELRRALWGIGYASVPFHMRASDVGAPHERSRIYVVAHPNSEQLRELSRWWCGPGREMATEFGRTRDYGPGAARANDGIPGRVDRNRAIGNAIVPQCAEVLLAGIKAVSELRPCACQGHGYCRPGCD